MLFINKDCNSTEDKVWSRYRYTNTSANTNNVFTNTTTAEKTKCAGLSTVQVSLSPAAN